MQRHGDRERLDRGQDDGQIAGPLGNLAPAQFAFLLQTSQWLIHDSQQLEDDGRGDVRHDAQREDRQPAQVAAAEQIDQAECAAALLVKELGQQLGVYTRGGNMCAQPVDGQHDPA